MNTRSAFSDCCSSVLKCCHSSRSRGFTILELLTCLGVSFLLMAIVLPTLGTVRESSRRLQCNNNLRQLGIALHAYHEVHRSLPSAWRWDRENRTAFGWLPPLLPYLELTALQNQIAFDAAVDAQENASVRIQTVPLFLCPSDLTERTFVLYLEPTSSSAPANLPLFELPAASYVGVFGVLEPDDVWQSRLGGGVFCGAQPIRFQEITRGLSKLLIVGERRASTIPSTWLGIDPRGEDAQCRIVGNANLGPNFMNADECEFTSRHPGITNFLWADGRVEGVSDSIDPHLYRQMARRVAF